MAGKDDRKLIEALMFGEGSVRRFTQDSPVLPDVWIACWADPKSRHDLLLTPDRSSTPGELSVVLRKRIEPERKALTGGKESDVALAYNRATVVVELRFDELVRVVLPLTRWWRQNVWTTDGTDPAKLQQETSRKRLAKALADPEAGARELDLSPGLLWLARVVGMIGARFYNPGKKLDAMPKSAAGWRPAVDALARLMDGLEREERSPDALIWTVSVNRSAEISVKKSVVAIKADAARRVFDAKCDQLAWAIVDSGIDARHPAFRLIKDGAPIADPFGGEDAREPNQTRVVATWDFSLVRPLLDASQMSMSRLPESVRDQYRTKKEKQELSAHLKALGDHLRLGRDIDWTLVEPLIRVPHVKGRYRPPEHDHGTHVAGILGADWREDDGSAVMQGVCPDIRLYDLRVLDADGNGDEFSVIAALQFIRHLNTRHDHMVVQGVNVSLSIRHDVANYACGRTPVCEECERLGGAGVVVVAAAGNLGYERVQTAEGLREGYHSISITDPGNADSVITVGATHRYRPHTYGVSYFSSRGPTGDGRVKPDLVAPGEKITAPVGSDGERAKDGTSMAAPHVSGAAALLMARYHELIGEPVQIKQILKTTATDLGRERYFQGSGMVDILRALQSI